MPTPKYTASYPDLNEPVWKRCRFYQYASDPRPVNWPPPGPWWCSGYGDDADNKEYMVIVAYVKTVDEIDVSWPEHAEIEVFEENIPVHYSDRFPKQDWII